MRAYMLCADCDHFIEPNYSFCNDESVTRYIHLEDGDKDQDGDHDAKPTRALLSLELWWTLRPDLFVTHPDGKVGPNSAYHKNVTRQEPFK